VTLGSATAVVRAGIVPVQKMRKTAANPPESHSEPREREWLTR